MHHFDCCVNLCLNFRHSLSLFINKLSSPYSPPSPSLVLQNAYFLSLSHTHTHTPMGTHTTFLSQTNTNSVLQRLTLLSLSLVYLSPKQTHIRRPLAHYHTHVSFELGQPHSLAHLSNNAISNFNPTHSLTLFFLSVLRERLYLLSQSFTQFQST